MLESAPRRDIHRDHAQLAAYPDRPGSHPLPSPRPQVSTPATSRPLSADLFSRRFALMWLMILHSAVSGVYVVGSYKTFGQQQPQARVRRLPLPPRHFVARSMCTVSLSLVAARVGFLSLPRRLTLRNPRQRGGPILLGVDHRCRRLQEAVCDAHAPTGGDHAQVTATPSNAACARLPRPVRAPSSPPRSYTTLAKHRTTFLAATVLMLFCMGGNFAMFPAQARSRRISRWR